MYNTALMSAQLDVAMSEARADGALWGRVVESAVGAHLANAVADGSGELSYWRDGNLEVDFVLRSGRWVTGIEVRSSRPRQPPSGLAAFARSAPGARSLLVGGDGIDLAEFLSAPAATWL